MRSHFLIGQPLVLLALVDEVLDRGEEAHYGAQDGTHKEGANRDADHCAVAEAVALLANDHNLHGACETPNPDTPTRTQTR